MLTWLLTAKYYILLTAVNLRSHMQSLTISVNPPSCLTKNGLKRSHWQTIRRATKEQRRLAFFMAKETAPNWTTLNKERRASIVITEYFARIPKDHEGLACSVAPAVDGLIDANIIEDDNPYVVQSYLCRWEKVSKVNEQRTEICVTG